MLEGGVVGRVSRLGTTKKLVPTTSWVTPALAARSRQTNHPRSSMGFVTLVLLCVRWMSLRLLWTWSLAGCTIRLPWGDEVSVLNIVFPSQGMTI